MKALAETYEKNQHLENTLIPTNKIKIKKVIGYSLKYRMQYYTSLIHFALLGHYTPPYSFLH